MMAGYHAKTRREMLAYVPDSAVRVLDVGCGEGRFASALRESRLDRVLWGIEPSHPAAAIASQALDRVIGSTIELALAELPLGFFDCVVFNDVLEHLENPWRVLGEVRQLLTEQGVVVASLPNVRHSSVIRALWLEGLWEYADSGLLDRTHLRFFTPRTMVQLFESAGYSVTRLDGLRPTPTYSWKFTLISRLVATRPAELGFLQYAVVARPLRVPPPLGGTV